MKKARRQDDKLSDQTSDYSSQLTSELSQFETKKQSTRKKLKYKGEIVQAPEERITSMRQ